MRAVIAAVKPSGSRLEEGEDTVPLTVPYSWECVRDCPWKGPNARLLVRYAAHLSKFRVCVHSLSLAKR